MYFSLLKTTKNGRPSKIGFNNRADQFGLLFACFWSIPSPNRIYFFDLPFAFYFRSLNRFAVSDVWFAYMTRLYDSDMTTFYINDTATHSPPLHTQFALYSTNDRLLKSTHKTGLQSLHFCVRLFWVTSVGRSASNHSPSYYGPAKGASTHWTGNIRTLSREGG